MKIEKAPVLGDEKIGWVMREAGIDKVSNIFLGAEWVAQAQLDADDAYYRQELKEEIEKSLLTVEDISEELNRLSPDEGEREYFRAVTLLATRAGILGSLLEIQLDKILKILT